MFTQVLFLIANLVLFIRKCSGTEDINAKATENEIKTAKYIVIGAGLWGSTIAERIASVIKEPVLLVDKRNHIGGNCWSEVDKATGIEYHVYGSHIFHTSLENVWSYITQFTEFTGYRHHVITQYRGKAYNFPVNLKTINDFYGLNLKPFEVEDFIKNEANNSGIMSNDATNLEDKAISVIGKPLYEAFVKGYTVKQWQTDPKILPKEIFQRLPIRSSYASGYFEDSHEGLPKDGYYNLFKNMTTHPFIKVSLNTNWFDIRHLIQPDTRIFYSGPIDAYFNHQFGKLQYRSLEFKCETHSVRDFQGVSMLNFADVEIPYTRIHEFKHLHPERKEIMMKKSTIICYEFPKTPVEGDELYYPINTEENQKVFQKYAELVEKENNLIIAGRLGSYRYFDMDKVINNALSSFDQFLKR